MDEVTVTVNAILAHLYHELPRRRVDLFGESLHNLLKEKYQIHLSQQTQSAKDRITTKINENVSETSLRPEEDTASSSSNLGDKSCSAQIDSLQILVAGSHSSILIFQAAQESGMNIEELFIYLPSYLIFHLSPGRVTYQITMENNVLSPLQILYNLTTEQTAQWMSKMGLSGKLKTTEVQPDGVHSPSSLSSHEGESGLAYLSVHPISPNTRSPSPQNSSNFLWSGGSRYSCRIPLSPSGHHLYPPQLVLSSQQFRSKPSLPSDFGTAVSNSIHQLGQISLSDSGSTHLSSPGSGQISPRFIPIPPEAESAMLSGQKPAWNSLSPSPTTLPSKLGPLALSQTLNAVKQSASHRPSLPLGIQQPHIGDNSFAVLPSTCQLTHFQKSVSTPNFTAATFAQTKFGSTKLKNQNKPKPLAFTLAPRVPQLSFPIPIRSPHQMTHSSFHTQKPYSSIVSQPSAFRSASPCNFYHMSSEMDQGFSSDGRGSISNESLSAHRSLSLSPYALTCMGLDGATNDSKTASLNQSSRGQNYCHTMNQFQFPANERGAKLPEEMNSVDNIQTRYGLHQDDKMSAFQNMPSSDTCSYTQWQFRRTSGPEGLLKPNPVIHFCGPDEGLPRLGDYPCVEESLEPEFGYNLSRRSTNTTTDSCWERTQPSSTYSLAQGSSPLAMSREELCRRASSPGNIPSNNILFPSLSIDLDVSSMIPATTSSQ